jgi:ABC-type bacteriocin/lantibiotic exporter with double-glycine peptidase domain
MEYIYSVSGLSKKYGSKTVLDINQLDINKGEITAVIGPSGAGKSTLMQILNFIEPPTEGRLSFDGMDLSKQKSLKIETRREMAMVFQKPSVFSSSVYDNIACGNEHATREDVIAAAVAAEADGFISQLPEDYNTVLADDGKSFSGGQRQRIAIARALVKKAPILLFDEITSALDGENEVKILETMCKLKKNHAVVLISHKPNVEAYADEIFRLGTVN